MCIFLLRMNTQTNGLCRGKREPGDCSRPSQGGLRDQRRHSSRRKRQGRTEARTSRCAGSERPQLGGSGDERAERVTVGVYFEFKPALENAIFLSSYNNQNTIVLNIKERSRLPLAAGPCEGALRGLAAARPTGPRRELESRGDNGRGSPLAP